MKDDWIKDEYEELSLDKAFAQLVKLNQLFGKEKVKNT